MNYCPVCHDKTDRPIAAALHHFRLWESGMWRYLRGNCKQFGLRSGILSFICLKCPAFNTLWHWKHRRSRLVIGGQQL